MKSAQLERQLGKLDEALKTLEDAIKKFPQFDKLHMIRGQIHDSRGDITAARQAYALGCKSCPKSIPLWILSARLEVKAGVIIKARGLLERARLYNPKNDELWTESIRIEEKASGPQQAKSLLARGKIPLSSRSRTQLTYQQCRNAPLHLTFGQWPSGWRTLNNEKVDHSTHSRKPKHTRPSLLPSLDYSGLNEKLRRHDNGWVKLLLQMEIGEMHGDGG